MRITRSAVLIAPILALAASSVQAQPLKLARLYQGRRTPEQTERFSQKARIGRDGRVSISNVSGDIIVSAGGGDEVTIDAVKHGDRGSMSQVRIVVEEHPGRVDISTDYGVSWRGGSRDVSVDYTIVMPAGASLDARSVSGRIRVTGVKGAVRLNAVSGSIVTSGTPRAESARTVSGDIELSDISHDDNLSVSSVSGSVQLGGVKARAIDLTTVSGDLRLRDAACERLSAKSVSGSFEYSGTLAKNGRYDVNSHSGSVRFALGDNTGFELGATSFSGSIRSDFQMTVGGDKNPTIRSGRGRGFGPRNESLQATFGDGSASLNVRTFSGNVTITRR